MLLTYPNIKFQKPDGTIEYGASGCCCPPGKKRKGQHTNSSTSWYRINNGEWKRIRSFISFKTIGEVVETCEEFAGMAKA